jgi:hypothetical protein
LVAQRDELFGELPPGAECGDEALAVVVAGRQRPGADLGHELGDDGGVDAVVLGKPAKGFGEVADALGIEL